MRETFDGTTTMVRSKPLKNNERCSPRLLLGLVLTHLRLKVLGLVLFGLFMADLSSHINQFSTPITFDDETILLTSNNEAGKLGVNRTISLP